MIFASGSRDKKTGRPSGFEDSLPAEQLMFNKLMAELSFVVESYGFSPIDTPAIEWMDTLKGHDDTGGKLIYRVFNGYETPEEGSLVDVDELMDKGLRFDLTVPLARFYGQHANELPLPFRRYQWGKVFRGESAQTGKGRYREFYQFDADAVGSKGVLSDAEAASMIVDAMRRLKLPAILRINNRRLLDGLLEVGKVTDPEVKASVLGSIDKYHKIGKEKVVEEVTVATSEKFAELVGKYLAVSGSNVEKLDTLTTLIGKSDATQEAVENLRSVVSVLNAAGYEKEVELAPEIVRGLGYYTGIIYETYIVGFEKYGSVVSGGRYDKLISALGGPDQPAVGLSFGVSRLLDVLKANGWKSSSQTPAKVIVLNFDEKLTADYFAIAAELRQGGIPTQLYSDNKKMGNQLKYASEMGIPFAIIVGGDEQAKGTTVIRNLNTREQREVLRRDLVSTVHDEIAK